MAALNAPVLFCPPMHVYTGCTLPCLFLFCCVSPSNITVKFCHTVNSELPWFQEEFGGYQLLVDKFIRRDDPCRVPVLLLPHILQWNGFSL